MTNPNDPHTNTSHTTTREVRTEKRSGSTMAFIVGGLVVAVLVIAWVLFSGGDGDVAETGGDDNVSVEGAETATEETAEEVGEAAEEAGDAVEGAAEEAGDADEEAAEPTD